MIIYDDLAANTIGVYRHTLQFLGLETNPVPTNLPPVNCSRYPRSPALRRLVNGKWIRLTALKLRPWLPHSTFVTLRSVQERLLVANSRPGKRPPLAPTLRAQLKREFAPEIERLSELLGRDLTYWSE